MQAEFHPQGLTLDRPAVVIRGGAAVLGAGSSSAAPAPAATCPRCGKTGGDCCKQSDSLAISDQAKQLASTQSSEEYSLTIGSLDPARHGDASNPLAIPGAPPRSQEDENAAIEGEQAESDEGAPTAPGEELSPEEEEQVQEMRARDAEVRAHEQAHLAVAGGQAVGGPQFETERGPDGGQYAVAGEVKIRFGGDTPERRLREAETAHRAALAPAEPSAKDRATAADAAAAAQQARTEIATKQAEEGRGESSPSGPELTPVDEARSAVEGMVAPGGKEDDDTTSALHSMTDTEGSDSGLVEREDDEDGPTTSPIDQAVSRAASAYGAMNGAMNGAGLGQTHSLEMMG